MCLCLCGNGDGEGEGEGDGQVVKCTRSTTSPSDSGQGRGRSVVGGQSGVNDYQLILMEAFWREEYGQAISLVFSNWIYRACHVLFRNEFCIFIKVACYCWCFQVRCLVMYFGKEASNLVMENPFFSRPVNTWCPKQESDTLQYCT
jgi:hypothetical protein